MSAALKLTTLASSIGLLGAGAAYSMRTPSRDFSSAAQGLDHTAEIPSEPAMKPKLPSNFISFTIGKYEFTNGA